MENGVSSRRAFLLGGLGAAVVAALRPVAASADAGDALILGQPNSSASTTELFGNLAIPIGRLSAHVSSDGPSAILGSASAENVAGVEGFTDGGIGVLAQSNHDYGTALSVVGRPEFIGASGLARVRRNKRSVTVHPDVWVNTRTLVLATVNGAGGVGVLRVQTNVSEESFTIYLTAEAPTVLRVAWFLFERSLA